MDINRGDIFYADLSPVVGSEQGGIRPVLIIQNNVGNKYSPTVIVAAITSQLSKAKLPTHIELSKSLGLCKDSVLLLEQIRALDKRRLQEKICSLDCSTMNKVDVAIMVSFGLVVDNNSFIWYRPLGRFFIIYIFYKIKIIFYKSVYIFDILCYYICNIS